MTKPGKPASLLSRSTVRPSPLLLLALLVAPLMSRVGSATDSTSPTANPQRLTTPLNTAVNITLTGSDPQGRPLTYAVGIRPTHGVLTGDPPNLTYTPASNYTGYDGFNFTVNNGVSTSSPASVYIYTGEGPPPTAESQHVNTGFNAAVNITLSGSDFQGRPLTYAVATNPSRGSLSGTAPNLTYTPVNNYSGDDSFTFTVNNGVMTSSPATVGITIAQSTAAPTANGQRLTTPTNTALSITLTGSDPQSRPLTYAVGTNVTHGTLSGTAPNLTYTPVSTYNGYDGFTFTVNNGVSTSSPATVYIYVGDSRPVASPQRVSTPPNTAVNITLTGSDPLGRALTYAVVTNPTRGTLSGTAPNLTYTPFTNYTGDDYFTFTVNNGFSTSSPAPVGISVRYPGRWRAQGLACGPDNLMRVLWTNEDGRVALWVLDANGNLVVNNTYGPFSGWHAVALAIGGDNKIVVLWLNDSGKAAIWRVAPGSQTEGGGALELNLTAGPYSGWLPVSIAVGFDYKIRVLWVNADGKCALWQLSTSTTSGDNNFGLEVNNTYGPFAGWHAVSLAVGGDNKMCVLWDNDDGTAALWRVNPTDSSLQQNITIGPYTGWIARAISCGADFKMRVLWTNTDGKCAIWVVSTVDGSGGQLEVNNTYGPYQYWTPSGFAVGGDNKVRNLWSRTDGTVAVWQLGSGDQASGGGGLELNLTFGPY